MNLVLDVDKLMKYDFKDNGVFKSQVFRLKKNNIKKANVTFYKRISYLSENYLYYLIIKEIETYKDFIILRKDGTTCTEFYSCCIGFDFGKRLIKDFKNNNIMIIE